MNNEIQIKEADSNPPPSQTVFIPLTANKPNIRQEGNKEQEIRVEDTETNWIKSGNGDKENETKL